VFFVILNLVSPHNPLNSKYLLLLEENRRESLNSNVFWLNLTILRNFIWHKLLDTILIPENGLTSRDVLILSQLIVLLECFITAGKGNVFW
jgi:hypothetical protein